MKVAGALPPAELELLTHDLQQKLSQLENRSYRFRIW